MILNSWTVIALGIALLTAALAAWVSWQSLRLYRKANRVRPGAQGDEWERKASLLLLVSVVVFLIKLPSWPFFYASLYSYVSQVPGAMCVYGVTQVKPLLSLSIQIVKPLMFFAGGLWLILRNNGRDAAALPLSGKGPLLLAAVSLLAVSDSLLEIIFYTTFDTKTEVACCTTVFDLPALGTERAAASLGVPFGRALLLAYYGVNILLILLLARVYRTNDRSSSAAAAGMTVMTAGLSVYAWYQVLAPKLMDLPDHHCIYCMWQYAPISMAMTGLFVLGIASAGWAVIITLAGEPGPSSTSAIGQARFWCRVALVSLAASLVLLLSYL